jgi:hypothetical protein
MDSGELTIDNERSNAPDWILIVNRQLSTVN